MQLLLSVHDIECTLGVPNVPNVPIWRVIKTLEQKHRHTPPCPANPCCLTSPSSHVTFYFVQQLVVCCLLILLLICSSAHFQAHFKFEFSSALLLSRVPMTHRNKKISKFSFGFRFKKTVRNDGDFCLIGDSL